MFRQNQDMIRSNYICESYDKSDKCEIEKQEINKEAKTDFSSESQIIKTEKSRSIVENESQVNSEMDKISQETIKENFPFPTFLEDQLEILTEIVDAIDDGYKYIILESGVGKSAIAATLANIYKSSFILSDNKKLQEKYHEEYDLINNDKFHVSNHSDAFNEFENSTFVLTSEAEKFLKENKYIVYYYDNSLDEFISLEKYESLFKKSKVTDSIYDVLYRYYTNLANESVNNKQWDHYKTSIGHIINISVDNISDLKLLKLHIKYFILEANNWICDDYSDYYNPSFNLEFNKSRNDLIASLKLELNELQEIFDEAWSEVKIPSYTVTKADTFKKLILAFNGEDLNEIH